MNDYNLIGMRFKHLCGSGMPSWWLYFVSMAATSPEKKKLFDFFSTRYPKDLVLNYALPVSTLFYNHLNKPSCSF